MVSDSVACANCGVENPRTAKYCKGCGQPTANVACANCGATNTRWAQFCEECGAKLNQPPATDPYQAVPQSYGFPSAAAPSPSSSNWSTPAPAPGAWGSVPTRQSIAYATGWRRLAAALLDSLILLVPLIVIAFIGYVIGGEYLAGVLPGVAGGLYFWVMNADRGTLGKRILGIRVVNEAGNSIGLSASFVRGLIPTWVPLASTILVLGSWFDLLILIALLIDLGRIIVDDRKQAIHDSMAKSFVVKDSF